MSPLEDVTIMQNCKHCKEVYNITFPKECCKSCFFSKELKKLLDNSPTRTKWGRRKRLAYIALLVMVTLFVVGRICGLEVQLIATFFLMYGAIYTDIVNWLSRKF